MRETINKLLNKSHHKEGSKREYKKKASLYKTILGESLNEQELRAWLKNPTTLKITRLIKLYRANTIDNLIKNPDLDKSLIIGICQGYEQIIDLIEKTASNPEDVTEVLDEYINELNTEV